jgi:hypothetical protein
MNCASPQPCSCSFLTGAGGAFGPASLGKINRPAASSITLT